MQRDQKITLGEMRQSGGPTRLLAGLRRKNHRETKEAHRVESAGFLRGY